MDLCPENIKNSQNSVRKQVIQREKKWAKDEHPPTKKQRQISTWKTTPY